MNSSTATRSGRNLVDGWWLLAMTLLPFLASLTMLGAASATSPVARADQPSKAQRLLTTRKIRESFYDAFLRESRNRRLGREEVQGPLVGSHCFADGQVCDRFDILYSRWRDSEWGTARFWLQREGKVAASTFFRRVGGQWHSFTAGYNRAPEIPCPVLRSWGRPC